MLTEQETRLWPRGIIIGNFKGEQIVGEAANDVGLVDVIYADRKVILKG